MAKGHQLLDAVLTEFKARNDGGGTQKELAARLSAITGTTITSSQLSKFRADSGLSTRIKKSIEMACHALLSEWQVSAGDALHRASSANPPDRRSSQERNVLSILTGGWLMVHYRPRRIRVDEEQPERDFRIGVLIFGAPTSKHVPFTMLSSRTQWRGVARKLESHIVFTGEQTRMDLKSEFFSMIMHAPLDDIHRDMHGVINGSVYAHEDHPQYPVYASRVLLRPLVGILHNVTTPIGQTDVYRLTQFCQYVMRTDAEAWLFGKAPPDDMDEQKFDAIRAFMTREEIKENIGDRLIIRR